MLSRFILQDTAHLNVISDFMTLFTSLIHVPDLSLRDSFVQVIPKVLKKKKFGFVIFNLNANFSSSKTMSFSNDLFT